MRAESDRQGQARDDSLKNYGSFLDQLLRRERREGTLLGVVVVVAAAVLGWTFWDTTRFCLAGPVTLTVAQAAQSTNGPSGDHYELREGDLTSEVFRAQWMVTRPATRRRPPQEELMTRAYRFVVADGLALPTNDGPTGLPLIGTLREIPSAHREPLRKAARARGLQLVDRYFVLSEPAGSCWLAWVLVSAGVTGFGVFLSYLSCSCEGLNGIRVLRRMGDPTTIAAQIQRDLDLGRATVLGNNRVLITPSLLLVRGFAGTHQVFDLQKVVWVHAKPSSIVGTIGVRATSLRLHLGDGRERTIELSRELREKLMTALQARAPWIQLGWDERLETRWRNDKEAWLADFQKLQETLEGSCSKGRDRD